MINIKDHKNKTPLFYAKTKQMKSMLNIYVVKNHEQKALIVSNIEDHNFNEFKQNVKNFYIDKNPNPFEKSLLYYAITNDNLDVLEYLLDFIDINYVENNRKENLLHLASLYNAKNIVKFLITKIDLNKKDKYNLTALHIASIKNNHEIVEILLNKGLNYKLKDSYSKTALDYAKEKKFDETINAFNRYFDAINKKNLLFLEVVKSNDTQKILNLINGGVNIHIKDAKGLNALYYAVKNSNFEVSKILLNKNIDMDITDSNGYNLIYFAIKNNNIKLAKTLLEYGSDINSNYNKKTLLEVALENPYIETIKFLVNNKIVINSKLSDGQLTLEKLLNNSNIFEYMLDKVDINSLNKNGLSILHIAIINHKNNLFDLLIKNRNLQINKKTADYKTPLHLATIYNDFEFVKRLVNEFKINIDLKDKENKKAIDYAKGDIFKFFNDIYFNRDKEIFVAIQNRDISKVQNLLNKDVSLSIKDKNGNTPILYAVKMGALSIVKLLYKNGADIYASNNENQNGLHLAVINSHSQTLKYLIWRNVSLYQKDDYKKIPMDYALNNKIKNILIASYKANEKLKNKFIVAISENRNSALYMLRTLNKKHFSQKESEIPLIHLIAYYGNYRLLSYMKKDVNKLDSNARTPIFYAVINNKLNSVKRLLKYKADINIKDKDGLSPLHFATINGNEKIAKELISKNANLNMKDKKGNTPLHYAIKYNNLQVTSLLLKNGAKIAYNNMLSTPLHLINSKEMKNLIEKGWK
jgi:ankyrin repeat protein